VSPGRLSFGKYRVLFVEIPFRFARR